MAKIHFKRRDELEAELAELKSRTCNTCNHAKDTTQTNVIKCSYIGMVSKHTKFTRDFGCIPHWEAKDD